MSVKGREEQLRSEADGTESVQKESATAPEDSVINLIKGLRAESLQISDLKELERAHAANVISALRKLIEPLGKSYQIAPTSLKRIDKNASGIVLTPQGTLCLAYGSGLIITKSLDNLSSESLVRVLDQVLPEIQKHLAEQRRMIAMRTVLLQRVADELASVFEDTSEASQKSDSK